MGQQIAFAEIVEAADRLSPEEQETLIDLLRRRLAARGRRRVVRDVRAANREFESGQCRPTDVDALMREITS